MKFESNLLIRYLQRHYGDLVMVLIDTVLQVPEKSCIKTL